MANQVLYTNTEPDYIFELTLEDDVVVTVEAYESTYFSDDMPEGRYAYYTRHRDCDMSEPCSIKKNMGLTVNFWGTIVADKPIEFGDVDEIEIININEI